ncbi:MAG: glycosyltransferase family 2 protein [Ruminococcaceae bacterium]|nr:glycosyltransferase family 2 protein [Oscillospiraceae bacterium]
MRKGDILYVVVPCYNEQEVLPETAKRLSEKLENLIENKLISQKSRVVFVDDGSKDSTWEIISNLHKENELFSGIKLSGNRGHQNALLCGLMTVRDLCDATISIDADLQDDVNSIDLFWERYLAGYEIVYGVRNDRTTDSFFKRFTAQSFYKFMHKLGVNVVYNHADCRLMGKRSLEALSEYKEVNLFLRGMVTLVGFKSTTIEYQRSERFAGESKYPLKKMLALAANGIILFTLKPIRIILSAGMFFSILSFIGLLTLAILSFTGTTIPGWAFVLASVWFAFGLSSIFMGIIGEYVGKAFEEVKARPRYVVEEFINVE